MSRGKDCLLVSRQFLARNYPRPTCLLKYLLKSLSPTREGFNVSFTLAPCGVGNWQLLIARQGRSRYWGEMATMLFPLPGCQQISVNTLLCDALGLAYWETSIFLRQYWLPASRCLFWPTGKSLSGEDASPPDRKLLLHFRETLCESGSCVDAL